jgi:hypothetical protein
MILENDQLLASPVPLLTDNDLYWLDDDDQVMLINANYEDWENSRTEAARILTTRGPQSLAERLSLMAGNLL